MKKILLLFMATFAFGFQNISAQDAPIKITTGHPDLKVKINRCEASGKLVIIDLTFTNMNEQDAEGNTGPCTYNGKTYEPMAIDSQGNSFPIKFKVSNQNDYSIWATVPLLSEIPAKVSLRTEGVPESSEFFSRLNLNFDCKTLGLDKTNIIQIKNIPITRD